jgi:OOP family OmpA-OmpF porin
MTHPRYRCLHRATALVAAAGLIAPLAGCSTNRVWGRGAAAGAVAGTGTALAITLAVDPSDDTEQTGIVLGSAVGGAIVGALVGHYFFDKEKEPPKVAALPPPAPPPAPTPMEVLTGSHFAFNSAELAPSAKTELSDTVDSLKTDPALRVRIDGHTDSVGSAAYNVQLSKRRADSVKRYLVSQGIAADRIETQGLGLTKPIADNATAEGRAKNRRVEVHKAP